MVEGGLKAREGAGGCGANVSRRDTCVLVRAASGGDSPSRPCACFRIVGVPVCEFEIDHVLAQFVLQTDLLTRSLFAAPLLSPLRVRNCTKSSTFFHPRAPSSRQDTLGGQRRMSDSFHSEWNEVLNSDHGSESSDGEGGMCKCPGREAIRWQV